jgi:RimJ/RimL family protein N-acetyltransferase
VTGFDTSSPDRPPELRGRRVLLRPIEEADRPRLVEIIEEPEVARWWRRDE